MYFLIQLMSFYLPVDLPMQSAPTINPLYWKVGLLSLEDMKRRATEVIRKTADDLMKEPKPTDDNNPASTTPPEPTATPVPGKAICHECVERSNISQQGKLVITSSEIIPVVLPTYQGLPISNTWYSTTGAAIEDPVAMGQINIQRWLVLMHLAREPKLLENNRSAMIVAAAYLPGEKWPEFFNCGSRLPPCESQTKALNHQPAFGRAVPAWKGKNATEWEVAQKAFTNRYEKLLISQASSLPQDIYVVTTATLRPYSAEKGGLPIHSSGFLEGARRADDPQRSLKLASNYAAAVPNRLPQALQCNPSQCEEILNAIPGRQEILKKKPISQAYQVYLLVKTRITSVQGSQNMIVIEPGYVSAGEPGPKQASQTTLQCMPTRI